MREFLHPKSVMERKIRPERRGKSESVQQREVFAMNKCAAFVTQGELLPVCQGNMIRWKNVSSNAHEVTR
ncbi:hypothetical protein MSKU15_1913 [Komagataeibacter diospyri]|nr:hypothetical protein MSKU15_1913 [Komagataeibacter diospyri]